MRRHVISVCLFVVFLVAISGFAQPAITANPSAQNVCSGGVATFTAAADGGATAQWQQSSDGGATFADIAGATSPSLSVPATLDESGLEYRAIFTDATGASATAPATLTVVAADATIGGPASASANSAAVASGPSGMASYAWTIANGTITSAANAQNVGFTAGPSGTTTLTLATTNSAGCSATSSDVVTITPQPVITIDSVSVAEPARRTSTTMTFTLSLSNPSSQTVTVMYNTSNNTAIANIDYAPSCAVVTFPAGSTTQTVAITVYGSGISYAKSLWMNLSRPTNASIAKVAGYPMRGKGTINP